MQCKVRLAEAVNALLTDASIFWRTDNAKDKVKVSASIGAAILTGVIVAAVEAEEKIIQQEQIS